ncbi:MAG: UvrD-helicase domain-containing protein [Oscillospiraceae bacterium]|jgi:DNA helicase-2/ATP-dependent DNA helicase PcrA|nr:UvrD-helicase domain-containing protein [Oscillospiraceae bacterium]
MTDDNTARFAAARRRAIEREFLHLNEAQREAVLKTEGALLVLAGAGSGKTTVLINRIANLLRFGSGSDSGGAPESVTDEELTLLGRYAETGDESLKPDALRLCGVSPAAPWEVIAITFTNKAAGELKTRLADMLGESAKQIWAMTFHSACVRILRRDIHRLGYDGSFVIYDTHDSTSIIKAIEKELNIDDKQLTPRSALTYISRAKDEGLLAADFAAEAERDNNPMLRQVAKCYTEYEKRLRASGALDFDDLILTAVRLLEQDADAREYYQNKFRYVLVDEYQDTNKLQNRLTNLLAGGRRNICVVGDDDQSIYKFRGATVGNILGFEKAYRGAHVVRLERNYRSTSPILDAANDVISHNRTRHKKTLWTDEASSDLPELVTREDEREEARFIADAVIKGKAERRAWSDHVVLYRMNAQSNTLEYELKRHNIPYRVYGGTGFFERAEVKDVTAYLCAVNNPRDEVHLLRIINVPARGIGDTTQDALRELSAAYSAPVYALCMTAKSYPQLAKSAEKLRRFTETIEYLREASATMTLDLFYDALIESTGLIRALEAKQSDDNISRIENIREFKTNILDFMRRNPGGGLADFLSEIALFTDLDREQEDDCVALMTMHSAKGLEFDTVFVVGAEDGIFPGMRAIGDAEELEEERRLCYVAITRAKRRLYFVAARRRMLFGQTKANPVSSFVEEIAAEHLKRPDERGRRAAAEEDWFGESGGSRGFARPSSARGSVSPRRPAPPETDAPAAPAEPEVRFGVGDRVSHKAFGEGTVTGVTDSGGDSLLEVEFGDPAIGRKRLMRKSAAPYMNKL